MEPPSAELVCSGATISAPRIEAAIRALYAENAAAPSEKQIADKLNISISLYREILDILKDVEVELVGTNSESGREWITYSSGAREEPMFCCLRQEMVMLMKNALERLPKQERLLVTLESYEDIDGDKHLSMILGCDDSYVRRLGNSAQLHIRAALPNPHLDLSEVEKTGRVQRTHPPGDINQRIWESQRQARSNYDVMVQASCNADLSPKGDTIVLRTKWSTLTYVCHYVIDQKNRLVELSRHEELHITEDS